MMDIQMRAIIHKHMYQYIVRNIYTDFIYSIYFFVYKKSIS